MPGLLHASRTSTRRIWALLAGTLALGIALETAAGAIAIAEKLSPLSAVSVYTAILGFCILAAIHILNAHLPEDVSPSDQKLLLRFKDSGYRHVVLGVCIAMFYPAGYAMGLRFLHASETEAFLLGNLPGLATGFVLRRIWPISAGTRAETVRAHLLMVDRVRRVQSFGYAAFACLSLFAIMMMLPDMSRAWHGQQVHLGVFTAFSITGAASIFMLCAPWTWLEARPFARIMEDESLARFRLLAYRNAFFVMAAGLILVGDLVRNPPRLALVMVPVVFNLALFTAFATLVILEYRAGTFAAPDPAEIAREGGTLS